MTIVFFFFRFFFGSCSLCVDDRRSGARLRDMKSGVEGAAFDEEKANFEKQLADAQSEHADAKKDQAQAKQDVEEAQAELAEASGT